PPLHWHTLTTRTSVPTLPPTDTLSSLPHTPHRVTLVPGRTPSHTSKTSPPLHTPHHWHTLTISPPSLISAN
ncbi:hypothetical protein GBAR_LOCUS29786, partial [Geodia barretti]